jgi:hypothetical protein
MSERIPPGLFGPPDMPADPDKRLEGRLRRAARQQGLTLVKSRSRSEDSPLYGTYMLVDASTAAVVHAGSDTDIYGLSLDEVARHLGE